MEVSAEAAMLPVHAGDLPDTKPALTPPTSEDFDKMGDASSDLSDLDAEGDKLEGDDDEEDDDGEIEPDHYYEGGRIPIFKPTMAQFRDFKRFIDKIDKYGMRSGIVKVIPPKEWRDSLPALDEAVKSIRIKNPINQEFAMAGTHGTWTQANIEKQRSYNLPQWKALCEEPQHQPPAKRGERRRNQESTIRGGKAGTRTRATRTSGAASPAPTLDDGDSDAPKRKRGPGRPPGRGRKRQLADDDRNTRRSSKSRKTARDAPPTPTSPDQKPLDVKLEDQEDEISPIKPRGRQPKSSVAARRKYNRRDVVDEIDEEAFKDFDYHFEGLDEFTAERCQELETNYWKSLMYAPPMYGADMPGSLFDDRTTSWNVAKLPNLLDVLGQKIPGVNTAYLYLGMWKATFAWHLEDVDLYSINYIHFGAPKQWYSISQEDARRFEAAMKSIWPNDSKNCSQFLRHKTYLISPALLKSQFNITVNKLVHNEGEFVITYPYGYHSGYNLGYNCAESVNFATEAWLDYGRIAKKCDCEADSVWVDVADIERKLRGEPTPEYEEETDEDEDEDDDALEAETSGLPSPPASVKPKPSSRKRKRDARGKDTATDKPKAKRIRIRIRAPSKVSCALCPNDLEGEPLLPTENGQKVHRICALYTNETYIVEKDGKEVVMNVAGIEKARLDLKCNFCRSKRGSCFQCANRKCTRAFHATCAAAAGVRVDCGPTPTWGEDGTEYYTEGYDFRCRFHRPRRAKNIDVDSLESNKLILEYARSLKTTDVIQAQHLGGEIFAGVVVENRPSEMSVLINLLPEGGHLEVEWKWLCVNDPGESQLLKPSPSAKPLPAHMNLASVNVANRLDAPPVQDELFTEGSVNKWAEFNTCLAEEVRNRYQVRIDLARENQIWHYLPKTSTEARDQYTEDPSKPRYNIRSNFLDTVKPAPAATPAQLQQQRRSYPASYPTGSNIQALNGAMAHARQQFAQAQQARTSQPQPQPQLKNEKPYEYKPKTPAGGYYVDAKALATQRHFQADASKKGAQGPALSPTGLQAANGEAPAEMRQYRFPYGNDPQNPSPPQMTQQAMRGSYGSSGSPQNFDSSFPAQSPYAPVDGQGSPSVGSYPRPGNPALAPHPNGAQPINAPPPPRSKAPVANMMGHQPPKIHQKQHSIPSLSEARAAVRSGHLPHSKSSHHKREPSQPIDPEYLALIQKYPYLRNSYLRKPKYYTSPYLKKGGFSPQYGGKEVSTPSTPGTRSSISGRSDDKSQLTPYQKQEMTYSKLAQVSYLQQNGITEPWRPQPQYQTEQQFQQQLMGAHRLESSELDKAEKAFASLKQENPEPQALSKANDVTLSGDLARFPQESLATDDHEHFDHSVESFFDFSMTNNSSFRPFTDAGNTTPVASVHHVPRPEYSPLSDLDPALTLGAGPNSMGLFESGPTHDGTIAPSMAMLGKETWRFN